MTQDLDDLPTKASSIDALDWARIECGLNEVGFAVAPRLLSQRECDEVRSLYEKGAAFRSTITMARHGFGEGEYRYFSYPLPDFLGALRTGLYPHLAAIANRWSEALGEGSRFPAAHEAFLAACHREGQRRPTPLLLRYRAGDYNCLHQDLYGEMVFPLQVAVLLSAPNEEFTGGEFVLTEQRPRRQSRASVVPLGKGDAVVFAVNQRPAIGSRGFYRLAMRHGVSTLNSGERFTLGVIFHDAK